MAVIEAGMVYLTLEKKSGGRGRVKGVSGPGEE